MNGSTWRPGCRVCATYTRYWMLPCCKSTSTSLCWPPWGPPGQLLQSTPLKRLPLQWYLLPPASLALRPRLHPLEPPHQPLKLRSLRLLSWWALQRSFLRTESLTLQNSAGVACKSWSPLLPTDTAQTWPCSQVALSGTHPATKCQLPVSVPGSNPQLRKKWQDL